MIFFLDATSKSAPKVWYQLFNIWGYIRKHDYYVPIANILMSNKSYEIYDKVFKDLIYLFESFQIDIEFKDKSFMTDYEKTLRIAVKNNFVDSKIRGCYFHHSKMIYKKCKNYNLFSKKKRKNTVIIAFILKIFPYIPKNLREDYISKVENFIKDLEPGYKKLIIYFKKNWLNNKYFTFSEISYDEIKKRTNNICESFHRNLNNIISLFILNLVI